MTPNEKGLLAYVIVTTIVIILYFAQWKGKIW